MKAVLLAGIGGAIGSVMRYGIAQVMKEWYTGLFPWHTFAVNIIGCFLIGLLFSLALQHHYSDQARVFLMTGLIGGFTTYSSFGLETFNLFRQGHTGIAGIYMLATNLLGLLAVWAGYALQKTGG